MRMRILLRGVLLWMVKLLDIKVIFVCRTIRIQKLSCLLLFTIRPRSYVASAWCFSVPSSDFGTRKVMQIAQKQLTAVPLPIQG